MDLDDVSGRVLFPSPVQGPWLPFLRFAETATTGAQDDSGVHSHQGEEVLNYILEGRVEYEDDVGQRSLLDPGAIVLLTARTEAHHNLTAKPPPRSRWLSVVVQYPLGVGAARHPVQIASKPNASRESEGSVERRLVGPGAPIASASGLECLEIQFREAGQCVCPIGPERRAVAYLFEGSGSIDGLRVDAGAGVLTENSRELEFRCTSASRLFIVTASRTAVQ
jgi:quercetin 2,3-dioxygenase